VGYRLNVRCVSCEPDGEVSATAACLCIIMQHDDEQHDCIVVATYNAGRPAGLVKPLSPPVYLRAGAVIPQRMDSASNCVAHARQ
jgi:hypothetical protein